MRKVLGEQLQTELKGSRILASQSKKQALAKTTKDASLSKQNQ